MSTGYIDLPAEETGVFSLNGLVGALTLAAGSGITITPSGGNTLTIGSTDAGGTVTSVSVVSANGFAGTVANPTTTPAITLSTTITGILKGNGTAISAAISGTDYQPAGNYITALTGDVTASGPGSVAATIANNVVTNAKLATIATATFKGRTTAGTGNVEDLTATQATALLNSMVGDSGSGGTKGLAPAPSAGDAAAGKFLKADGTWAAPSGGSTMTTVSGTTYTTLAADNIVHCTNVAARTITVISAASLTAGQQLTIKDAAGTGATANVTIVFSGGQLCDGSASIVITANYGVFKCYTDGSNFFSM